MRRDETACCSAVAVAAVTHPLTFCCYRAHRGFEALCWCAEQIETKCSGCCVRWKAPKQNSSSGTMRSDDLVLPRAERARPGSSGTLSGLL